MSTFRIRALAIRAVARGWASHLTWADFQYDVYHTQLCAGDGHTPTWARHVPTFHAATHLFTAIMRSFGCAALDHDFYPDGDDRPDSGGEGFTCRRCGMSYMAWH